MRIKYTQNIYPSANGQSRVAYYVLEPEQTAPRGVVQISHGIYEYFARYTAFAKYLCSLGYIVCGNDHIGHGASVMRPAELGFFAPRNGWQYLVDDVATLTRLLHTRYPALPFFLLGHSIGSLLVRLCLPEIGGLLAGCILVATAGPTFAAQSGSYLANSVARKRGSTFRSGQLNALFFRGYNRKITQPRTVFDWLSRDENVVALYQSDEKCNFIYTATGFRDLCTLLVRANRLQVFRHTPHTLPLFLLAGDKDPFGQYGDGVRRVAGLYRSAGVRDIEMVFYKGARHDVLNELGRMGVYGDISRWLEKHLPTDSPSSAAPPDAPQ